MKKLGSSGLIVPKCAALLALLVLIRTVYSNFQLYENYDTRPSVNVPKNNRGVTTSLGWTL